MLLKNSIFSLFVFLFFGLSLMSFKIQAADLGGGKSPRVLRPPRLGLGRAMHPRAFHGAKSSDVFYDYYDFDRGFLGYRVDSNEKERRVLNGRTKAVHYSVCPRSRLITQIRLYSLEFSFGGDKIEAIKNLPYLTLSLDSEPPRVENLRIFFEHL